MREWQKEKEAEAKEEKEGRGRGSRDGDLPDGAPQTQKDEVLKAQAGRPAARASGKSGG